MMFAYPFLEPVDANSSPELRDYYKIIPKPMDLGTLQENLQAGLYRTIDLFVADVRLLFANCYRFHGADAEIAKVIFFFFSFSLSKTSSQQSTARAKTRDRV